MLISFCVPSMNRLDDLVLTLPLMIATANASPPTEIVLLDYGSTDGLAKHWFGEEARDVDYVRYSGRVYYHMAHAYNLAVKSSNGDWVVIAGADALFAPNYVTELRKVTEWADYARCPKFKGIVAVKRTEFIAAGGYDEDFELYMGEDKEFESRLHRRGAMLAVLPAGLVSVKRTSAQKKLANFNSSLSKREMMQLGTKLRKRNERMNLLVANEGREWGAQ